MTMSWYMWQQDYVPVAVRRKRAAQKLKKLKTKGQSVSPVTIEGRTIARSFWGKAWCDNLERYSDYENRLPRGRSYVRNGSVIDLQIAKGEVKAFVSGSELYSIKIDIMPVKTSRWKSICKDCAGGIDTLIELLQGRLAKSVMDRVCREGDGLFPAPKEIRLSCSCPDWADMCKHVAAALYGIGARLDQEPKLLFVLRGVDETELIAGAGQSTTLAQTKPAAAKVLDDADIADVFGLELAETADNRKPSSAPQGGRRSSSREARSDDKSASATTMAGPWGKGSSPASSVKKGRSKTSPKAKLTVVAKPGTKARSRADKQQQAVAKQSADRSRRRKAPLPVSAGLADLAGKPA
jgi:uncharacterized Zn finger protein